MKTRYYKTLKGLLKQTQYEQISLSDYKTKRFCHKKLGWISFKLSESAEDEFLQGFAKFLNVEKWQLQVCSNCGLLGRLTYSKYGFRYCAGQDYSSEMRYLRKWIRTK